MRVAGMIVLTVVCGIVLGRSAAGQSSTPAADETAARRLLQRDAYAAIIRADMARDEKRLEDAAELYVTALDLWVQLAGKSPDGRPANVERNIAHCRNEIRSLLAKGGLRNSYGDKLKERLVEQPSRPPPAAVPAEPPPEEAPAPGATRYSEEEMRQELERLRTQMFEATRREAAEARKRAELDSSRRADDAGMEKARHDTDEARKESEAARRKMEAAVAAARDVRKQLDAVNRKCEDLQKQKRELELKLGKMGEVAQTAESAKAEQEATEKLLKSIDKENRSLAAEKKDLEKRVDRLEETLLAAKSEGRKKPQKKPSEAKAPAASIPPSDVGRPASGRLHAAGAAAGDARVAADITMAAAVTTEGARLMREGQNDKAYELVMFGLAKSPDNLQLQLMLASLHIKAGRCKDAVDLMLPLVGSEQGNGKVRVVLGAAYFGLGKCDEARMELEMALGLDPDISEAHYNFAQLLLNTKPPDPARAREHYKKALALGAEPDPVLEAALDKALPGGKK